ncbi:cobalamin-binding protein [Rhizobium sp. RU36D]|uniref:cobalamin B12-binding domain-containing protein n=1 Tax=Rhizobium sp. RU36D TaxID=1907415 RepID=UPI0009D88D91|nr:cobalamin-binding protein [Rhizobium sp. RU36D]SMC53770.1 Methanogenic corrinoid protein MtbC1 [Rhizobium sp. RU36D]
MAGKKPDNPEGAQNPNVAGDPAASAAGKNDAQLNKNDHRLLERVIRRSVSNIVGASHQEILRPEQGQMILTDHDLSLHPEHHPTARQMPGTEKAVRYRDALVKCLFDPDPRHHRSFIEDLLGASVPVQTLAIHLFAPVAARLGDLWCTDEADFMQVAMASTRLTMIVNHVSHAVTQRAPETNEQRRILLARTRGAMHTIGVSIVASCFRDMGWTVEGGSDLEIDDELYMRLSRKPYRLLGISVGRVDELAECSQAIHRVHSNRQTHGMKIALGGPAVIASPLAFQRIGADFVTRSALDVVQLASHA